MADEQQVTEEVVTQEPDAPQPEVQEAEVEATAEPEVDWRAQAERLEQQLKTAQGRNRTRDDTDAASKVTVATTIIVQEILA